MGTRVLGSVHKTGGTRPGFSHAALMVAVESVKVAGSVAGKDRGAKVARLLKIVYTRVGWYIHVCPPRELLKFMLHYIRERVPCRKLSFNDGGIPVGLNIPGGIGITEVEQAYILEYILYRKYIF